MRYKIVIADTSCFILLDKINELNLLHKLFDKVVTTKEVANEFGKSLPSWVSIEVTKDQKYQRVLALEVDVGEASAIALSEEIGLSMLILDDSKARKLAQKLGLAYTGTLGVLARARREGILNSVKPIIEKIRKTNFRFSEDVFAEMLKASGESF